MLLAIYESFLLFLFTLRAFLEILMGFFVNTVDVSVDTVGFLLMLPLELLLLIFVLVLWLLLF